LKVAGSGGGDRGVGMQFKNMQTISGNYTVEMDLALSAGNDANKTNNNFYLATTSFTNDDNTAVSSYIANLYAAKGGDTVWSLTNAVLGEGETAAPSITMPKDGAGFAHVKAVVDVTAKTAVVTITNGENVISERTVNLVGDSTIITGIKTVCCRYYPAMGVDNIKVYATPAAVTE